MTRPAKRLESVRIVRILARLALHRRDMIALKPTGLTTFDAPVSIALEYGAADGGPPFSSQGSVEFTHWTRQ